VYDSETDLVVHFQAVPVRLELLETVFAHLADTTEASSGKGEWYEGPS
jgi:hypothetical protein